MQRWEYHVTWADPEQKFVQEACDVAGGDGWELVSAFVIEEAVGLPKTRVVRLIFKRPAND